MMCSIDIPDDVMQRAGWNDAHAAAVEIACRLYDTGVLSQPDAVSIAGVSRVQFWNELAKRGLPWMRIDAEDYWQQELKTLKELNL